MAGAGSDGEALAPRMQIIEMNDKLRNRQEIVNGLNIFLEENEEEASLEELEEESDVSEEEETETLSEDGPKEAHNNVRASHKVSLRSITSMTDEERFNMRIKKFGINTSKEFRKSPGASCFGLTVSTGKENADMEKKRRRLERFRLL
uniref:RIKEN cDNA 1700019A02 gene n=1 Tax=Peromyscus maniculatus bairdii TaxID=230844 RepID=A0A8C8TD31_PERMB